ncbi:putative Zinc finger, RING-type [Helianthus debilis subsp. tardiflorus]
MLEIMSTPGQVVKYARNSRRRKAVLDLNVPPVENLEQVGGPTISVSHAGQGDVPSVTVAHGGGQAHQPTGSTQPATIDVEELDDDVIISSPRAFEEAKKKSRRSRTVVVDVEAEEAAGRHGLDQAYKRRRGPSIAPVINCELYVNLDGSSGSMRGKAQYVAPSPPPPPPPPKEPTFSCPVCMGPLVEEVTTKCGHIFCKACITAAINAQHKCPTCRQKLTNRNLIRVYLPAAK